MLLTHCPHCQKDLQLTQAQQEKIEGALASLPEGKTLKITCPLCRKTINLRRDGTPVSEGATASSPAPTAATAAAPAPPAPPNISWLNSGEKQPDLAEVITDVPLAMVLIDDAGLRQQVSDALAALEYRVEFPKSAAAAKERMRFVNFAAVVLHSDFAGGDLARSDFHQHMRKMPMATRRMMLYVLIGPRFNTLYDLEALAHSANLVVNDRDAAKMPLLLKKALHDYQLLFGPYLEALKAHGKL